MQIHILLFASLREAASKRELLVTLPEGALAGAALETLSDRLPNHRALLERCAIAVNAEYAPSDQVLQNGDVVAIIPPVSGGNGEA